MMGNTAKDNDVLIQQTINKQVIVLKQDQNTSNSIMAKVLAELENLIVSLGYQGETYFQYYTTKGQNKNQIINQIVLQMIIFESSYKNFVKKNPKKEYEYPGNCAYKFIVDLISEWKKHLVKDKSNKLLEKYYDAFLGVLEGKKLDKKILNDFENIDKDSKPMNDEDLNRVLNAGAISTSLTNDKNKQIEKEMIEKGDYTVNIVIGGKSEDNQFNKQFEKNDNNLKKDKEELYKFFEGALGCLEIIYYQIKNSEKYQYASNVKKEIKKLIFEKYEQYLEKFNEKNIYISQNYNYNFFDDKKRLEKAKKELENWKKNCSDNNKFKSVIKNAIKVFCEGKEDSVD